ncbi:tyrosine-protein phosphatase non-receptor type 6 [Colletotrichum tofieldiae]|nr:tyrosine-protein phosphatase non-receptor type 6 [Colletotrichum tofieldiae]
MPPADVLYGKFRSWGWPGRCFVLKGHYREFSVSYSKSIAGSKVTGEARVYAEALLRDGNQTSTPSGGDDAARRAQYEVLLTQIDSEGRLGPRGAMSQHERDLEAEFRRRVPDLYRKALDVQGSHRGAAAETPPAAPGAGTQTATAASGEASTGHTKAARWDGSSTGHPVGRGGGEDKGGGGDGDGTTAFGLDTKAPLVEHLDRGLSYIRQGRPADASVDASPAASPDNTTAAAANTPAGLSKLAAEGCHAYFDSGAAVSSPSDDSYVKIARGDALQAGDHPPISSPSSFPQARAIITTRITTADSGERRDEGRRRRRWPVRG